MTEMRVSESAKGGLVYAHTPVSRKHSLSFRSHSTVPRAITCSHKCMSLVQEGTAVQKGRRGGKCIKVACKFITTCAASAPSQCSRDHLEHFKRRFACVLKCLHEIKDSADVVRITFEHTTKILHDSMLALVLCEV